MSRPGLQKEGFSRSVLFYIVNYSYFADEDLLISELFSCECWLVSGADFFASFVWFFRLRKTQDFTSRIHILTRNDFF